LRDHSFFDRQARVKWWCKRPPEALVTELAGKALSGAMPNREARKRCPRGYGFRVGSLNPSVRTDPEEWTSARAQARPQNPAYYFPVAFFIGWITKSLTIPWLEK